MFGKWRIWEYLLYFMMMTATVAIAGDPGINIENYPVAINGTFDNPLVSENFKAVSSNGQYRVTYDIADVGDENRFLENYRFYENDNLLYTLQNIPGADLYISNSGITAFLDHSYHFRNELTIHFYDKTGEMLYSQTFHSAALFGFSQTGDKFGVGDKSGLHVLSISDRSETLYPNAQQFDISEDDKFLALAYNDKITVYDDSQLLASINTDMAYIRKVKVSSINRLVAAIDKKHLRVYSLDDGRLLFEDELTKNQSFRDLRLVDDKILTGVHYRDKAYSKGILNAYRPDGAVLLTRESSSKKIALSDDIAVPDNLTTYEEIPWPFVPFDSMHTVWNYYEQHMGYYEGVSYLHQGLDMIVPIAEPTYAVTPGVVKCVLTLGGDIYWRMAISPEQDPGYSNGWLYAHLIENTIQFDVGDTVLLHDYLGDIIQWEDDWGHIHFVEIRDTGLVWDYFDNEWGINYNPLLSLTPDIDTIPPVIVNVFNDSKFGFSGNETSDYFTPDSVAGDIDIVVKVIDYVGDSEWQQPAYRLYYWITNVASGDIIQERTLAQILNHQYGFYDSERYFEWSRLLYKHDEVLMPSSWMYQIRNYHHILTNNNGDSVATLDEKNLAFSTDLYLDGTYRIFVEAYDEYGNCAIDSQDVYFYNGNVDVEDNAQRLPSDYTLEQNYPNPFNPDTKIEYNLPEAGYVMINIFNVMGQEVRKLVAEKQEVGSHSVVWDGFADDGKAAPSGVYLYKITANNYSCVCKMSLVR